MLIRLRFEESQADLYLYYRKRSDKILIVALWVDDDDLVVGSCKIEIDEFLCKLSEKFETTVFENVKMFVEMEICRLSNHFVVKKHIRKKL